MDCGMPDSFRIVSTASMVSIVTGSPICVAGSPKYVPKFSVGAARGVRLLWPGGSGGGRAQHSRLRGGIGPGL